MNYHICLIYIIHLLAAAAAEIVAAVVAYGWKLSEIVIVHLLRAVCRLHNQRLQNN